MVHNQNLEQLAAYLYQLIVTFEKDSKVTGREPYQLIVRLFKEQCQVVEKNDQGKDRRGGKQVKVKKGGQGETLQSPFDPDASYGHKGTVRGRC